MIPLDGLMFLHSKHILPFNPGWAAAGCYVLSMGNP